MAERSWLTREQAASRIGVSSKCLIDWADRGKGPPYHKMGHRTIYYEENDVEAYIESCRVDPSKDSK